MNEKLRTILNTAWNEPRHFFFWLTILSICGFAAAYIVVELAGPALLLAFIILACVLGFAVSVPAFILAWVPPVRRAFAWLLGRRLLVLACLATLVALFYAVEDWRGRRAWQNFKREQEAKGERFDLASFIPPPVPPDQNFFETPLWQDMRFVKTNGTVVWSDTNWGNHAILNIYGPQGKDAPSTANWAKAQHVDLAAWQAFYRGSNNLFAAQSGPPTNYFPVANAPQSPAADVLLALGKFNENRQLLIASCSRPFARFWANYDDGPGTLLPHLARVKACVQYLSLHADAALQAGDREAAVEDLNAVFRLIESIRREPTLIAQLVRIAAVQIALQPVWEGLADRQWSERELSLIEGELGKLDFLADYEFSMRGERADCELWAVDYIHKAGINSLQEMVSPNQEWGPLDLGKSMGMAVFRLVPAGWFDQNKLSLCRLHENYLLPVVDLERRVVSPEAVAKSQAALDCLHRRPYDLLSQMLVPSLAGSARRFAYGQTAVDLARVACALERYRLANNQFPETLEALAPKYLEKLPHDLITGQPLKYRRTDDGRFLLYSVGWNETDDEGQVGLGKAGNLDISKGDWVWRYPAG